MYAGSERSIHGIFVRQGCRNRHAGVTQQKKMVANRTASKDSPANEPTQ